MNFSFRILTTPIRVLHSSYSLLTIYVLSRPVYFPLLTPTSQSRIYYSLYTFFPDPCAFLSYTYLRSRPICYTPRIFLSRLLSSLIRILHSSFTLFPYTYFPDLYILLFVYLFPRSVCLRSYIITSPIRIHSVEAEALESLPLVFALGCEQCCQGR